MYSFKTLVAWLIIIAAISISSGSALQKDDSFIVALKTDNSISDYDAMQNDEPITESEDAAPAEIYSLKIHSDIRFRYCRTQVISKVANRHANNSNEVVFQMVLPETAFISKFYIEIDGKVYEAHVKEKEEAKQIYTEAKKSGQSAGLVEVNARHANVFSVNINVEAKSNVTFNLTYEELLIRRFDRYEHVININPQKYARIPDFGVTVNLVESQNLTEVKVPALRDDTENAIFHDEEPNVEANITQLTGKSAFVSWTPTLENRRSHNWDAPAQEVRKFVLQYDVARESDAGEILLMNGYFVHFFAPKDILPLRKHVVFVLDTSGSMSGNRLTQLKQAMKYVLDDLKPDDYFNIIEFASTLNIWSPKNTGAAVSTATYGARRHYNYFSSSNTRRPEPVIEPRSRAPSLATEQNLRKAHEFMNSLVAGGGTDINAALIEALKLIDEGRPVIAGEASSTSIVVGDDLARTVEPMVMFLTDGEPTVGITHKDTILTAIKGRNTNKPVPIYSIGFGSGADFPFLKTLSLQNKAFARKIYEAGDADIQMRGFYREISSPALSDITFQYTSDKFTVKKVTAKRFPNYQRGSEIVVAGWLKPQKNSTTETTTTTVGPSIDVAPSILSVNVDAMGRNGDVVFRKQNASRLEDNSEDYFLERLWAYITIKQLLEKENRENETDEYVYYDETVENTDIFNTTAIITTTEGSNNDFDDGEFDEEREPIPLPIVAKSNETHKQRALRIALKYGFVTPITSLVVVKPNETASTADLDPLVLQKKEPAPVAVNANRRGASSSYSLPNAYTQYNRMGPGGPQGLPGPSYPVIIPKSASSRSRGNQGVRREEHQRQSERRMHLSASMRAPEPPLLLANYNDDGSDFLDEAYDDLEAGPRVLSAGLSRSGFNSNSNTAGPLRRLKWLKDRTGKLETFITVNQTRYTVLTRSTPILMNLPTCTLKPDRRGRVNVGTCKLLKDCVKRVFWNDRSVYLNDYFCPIQNGGQLLAGACCWTGTVDS